MILNKTNTLVLFLSEVRSEINILNALSIILNKSTLLSTIATVGKPIVYTNCIYNCYENT